MGRNDELVDRREARIPARAKALMVLVAIATIIAILLVPDLKQPEPPALPDIPTEPQANKVAPAPLPPVVSEQEPAVAREGDTARKIITDVRSGGTDPDLDEIFNQAEQLRGDQQLADAYLLYRFAASKGHPRAALVLGTQADPAFYATENSILTSPDPLQAYKWYQVAAAAGNGEAETRLQDLRDRIEQSAADGDEAARRLMLQWH